VRLSSVQRRVLIRMANCGVRVDDPDLDLRMKRTIATLHERGLAEQREGRRGRLMWRPTEHAKKLLTAHKATMLHKHSQFGYTSSTTHAMFAEPEALT
jgi:hypothetical protein